MEAPALVNPLDEAAGRLEAALTGAAIQSGLLTAGEGLPGELRYGSRQAELTSSCAFSLARRAGISPQAAAEGLILRLGDTGMERVWAENGYVNAILPEHTLRAALRFLWELPLPEPAEKGYPVSGEERLRRDRGCPLYAVRYLQGRLRVLAGRCADSEPALTGAERALCLRLYRVSRLLPRQEGAALLGLLAGLSGELRQYIDRGGAASPLLKAGERVLFCGLIRLNTMQ